MTASWFCERHKLARLLVGASLVLLYIALMVSAAPAPMQRRPEARPNGHYVMRWHQMKFDAYFGSDGSYRATAPNNPNPGSAWEGSWSLKDGVLLIHEYHSSDRHRWSQYRVRMSSGLVGTIEFPSGVSDTGNFDLTRHGR